MKAKGRVTIPHVSVSFIEVQNPKLADTTNQYKMNSFTFKIPEGIIPTIPHNI